jgi:hypothetical protein
MEKKKQLSENLSSYSQNDDFEMDAFDQKVILLVSFIALVLAMVGFSMSDVAYLLLKSFG